MKKRILIIGQSQFGSLVDTYQYCRQLPDTFSFTYVCWDYGLGMPSVEGTQVILVSRAGGKVRRLARLIRAAARVMRTSQYDLHVVVYFAGCGVLGLLSRNAPTVMDVRTGYVRGGAFLTWFHNALLAVEALCFSHVSVISEGLREQLGLPRAKCAIIPLGADRIEGGEKEFENLRLLYVGTMEHRRMHETVEGFTRFCESVKGAADVTYEIVGSGPPADVEALLRAIAASSCRDRIRYVGRVPYDQLKPFFLRNNVGIAYIPILPQFENQPPTKVFEYLLAGMPVIATDTAENRRVIVESNGVLCGDTPGQFSGALSALFGRRREYSTEAIRAGTERFTWNHIVRNQLLPYWESLMS